MTTASHLCVAALCWKTAQSLFVRSKHCNKYFSQTHKEFSVFSEFHMTFLCKTRLSFVSICISFMFLFNLKMHSGGTECIFGSSSGTFQIRWKLSRKRIIVSQCHATAAFARQTSNQCRARSPCNWCRAQLNPMAANSISKYRWFRAKKKTTSEQHSGFRICVTQSRVTNFEDLTTNWIRELATRRFIWFVQLSGSNYYAVRCSSIYALWSLSRRRSDRNWFFISGPISQPSHHIKLAHSILTRDSFIYLFTERALAPCRWPIGVPTQGPL